MQTLPPVPVTGPEAAPPYFALPPLSPERRALVWAASDARAARRGLQTS